MNLYEQVVAEEHGYYAVTKKFSKNDILLALELFFEYFDDDTLREEMEHRDLEGSMSEIEELVVLMSDVFPEDTDDLCAVFTVTDVEPCDSELMIPVILTYREGFTKKLSVTDCNEPLTTTTR